MAPGKLALKCASMRVASGRGMPAQCACGCATEVSGLAHLASKGGGMLHALSALARDTAPMPYRMPYTSCLV